jgi:DNA-binding XRE family transcriptional regulator
MPPKLKPLTKVPARAHTVAKMRPTAKPLSTRTRVAFGRKLRKERIAQGLSQQQVSDLTGVARNHLGQIERGLHNLTIETAFILAKAVGFSIEIAWIPLPQRHF